MPTEGISERARAKINLALHVRGRRADGYHALETVFAFVDLADEVVVTPADQPGLTLTGPFGGAIQGDNLATAAAECFGRGAHHIALDKRIPVAAGLGGGSADAAAVLRALARLHGVALDDPELFRCAEAIGSDVPACLAGVTAFGRGRGELLEPVPGMPGTPVLLVNPRVAMSTAEVFRRWDGVDRGPLGADPLLGRNDLEAPARQVAPVIGEVLALLDAQPGTRLVRMSGSGATCFALFEDAGACSAAAAAMDPAWWRCETRLA